MSKPESDETIVINGVSLTRYDASVMWILGATFELAEMGFMIVNSGSKMLAKGTSAWDQLDAGGLYADDETIARIVPFLCDEPDELLQLLIAFRDRREEMRAFAAGH